MGCNGQCDTHRWEGHADILWIVPWFYVKVGWDGQWDTHASVRGSSGHPVECHMESLDGMDSGTYTHLWEGQVDILWYVPWYLGMEWTIRHTCICMRDRCTSHVMSYGPMGSWDGMNSGTHMDLQEGWMVTPWNVLWLYGQQDTHICERSGWTYHGMSHGPIKLWDGIDCGTHASERDKWMDSGIHMHEWEGQMDLPWNAP